MAQVEIFNPERMEKLFRPENDTKNGQVTIIGGSELFHGAPLLSLTVASRIVDMVYFSSPDSAVGEVASLLKSRLSSFIWVPWKEVGEYIDKSDAILIGPGFMRYRTERNEKADPNGSDDAEKFTAEITKKFLTEYSHKKWVIDAGSLQVLKKEWIPEGSILTPNRREYQRLFGDTDPKDASKTYKCMIVLKGVVDQVCTDGHCVEVSGGNPGMAKGGTGDTLAGLVTALVAQKNEDQRDQLAASAASYIIKKAGDELFEKVKTNFNADDLASKVPEVLARLQK